MRLLLYVLTAWVVLSIPAALFVGRLCRLSEDPFDGPAVNSVAPPLEVSSTGSGCSPVDNCGCRL